MIKKLYFRFLRLVHRVVWWSEGKKIRIKCLMFPKEKRQCTLGEKMLILAPHSDDEWIGCYPFITHSNCIICSMNMNGGNDDQTRAIRYNEMKVVAEQYHQKLLKLDDDKIAQLRQLILNETPAYIAVPFFADWHEEHIDTIKILKEAIADYYCTIVMYQVSCPIPSKFINYVVPLSKKEWSYKWKTFKKTYRTQKGFPWRRFATIELAEGGYCQSKAANVFVFENSQTWKDNYFILSDEIINDVKKNINHPYRVLKLLSSMK